MTSHASKEDLNLALRNELEAEARREQFNKVRLNDDMVPTSFEDALTQLEMAGIEIESSSELIVDEFPAIEKKLLVNKKCIFLTWSISRVESETFGTPYFVVRGVTSDGERFRFTDGSTGIAAQLMKLTDRRVMKSHPSPNAGLLCENGLSASNYNTKDAAGNPISATTYYIAS